MNLCCILKAQTENPNFGLSGCQLGSHHADLPLIQLLLSDRGVSTESRSADGEEQQQQNLRDYN